MQEGIQALAEQCAMRMPRMDVMIKGHNESKDVMTKGRFKQTGT